MSQQTIRASHRQAFMTTAQSRHPSPSLSALSLAMGLALAGLSTSSWASGFALQNQNGSGTSTAFAGAAAVAEDASTIYFNPAGMTYLPLGTSVTVAGTVLQRDFKFRNDGSTATSPLGTAAISGPDGRLENTSLIPAAYISHAISPELRLGLGLGTTFGSVSKYDSDYFGRYSATKIDYRQVNLNPSIAFKVDEEVSLGFGLNIAQLEATFERAAIQTTPPFFNANDRLAKIKVDGTKVGYNLGAMWQARPDTRVGVSYRSRIQFNELNGTADVTGMPTTDVNSNLTTPASLSLSVLHNLTPKTDLLFDYTRTQWSTVQNLTVTAAANPAVVVTSVPYNFRNTDRVSIGARHQYTEALSLRTGIAYDKTPVPNAESRTVTLPDADRIWLAIGARYKLDKASSVDVGYAHILSNNARIDRTENVGQPGTNLFSQNVRGNVEGSANLFSVQYNRSF